MKATPLHKTPNTQIFIFVALACEAKPIIQFFDLKKDHNIHPFVIYKTNTIVLTVTGVGKVAMAGAVAYSLALISHQFSPVLLNIGIAGHKTQSTGSIYRASKIIDDDTGKAHYPPILSKKPTNTCVLTTVSKPVDQYQTDRLYDMEGAAFYEMSVRFSSSELVQCIKIVSDNERSPIENINKKQVYEWLNEQMGSINIATEELLNLSESMLLFEPDEYQQLIEDWHFTVSGKIRLKTLLRRWTVQNHGVNFTINKNEIKSGKEILTKLEAELNRLSFFL